MRKVTITKEMADFCRGILITGFVKYSPPHHVFAYKMIANNPYHEFDLDARCHTMSIGTETAPEHCVDEFYDLLEKLVADFPVKEHKIVRISKEEINALEYKLKKFLPYSMNDLRFNINHRTASIFTRWFTLIDHPIDTLVDTCLQKMIQVSESDIKQCDMTISSYQLKKSDAEEELTKLKELAKMAE